MIEPMQKIEIVGLLDELDPTLDILQSEGVVQVEEVPTIEESGHSHIHRIHLDEKRGDLLTAYEELLANIREIIEILGAGSAGEGVLDGETRGELSDMGPSDIQDHISSRLRSIRRLARQKRNLVQDMESARQYENLISTFLPLLREAGDVTELEQIGIVLESGETSVLQVLESRIKDIAGPETTLFHREMPEGKIGVFIVTPARDLPGIRQLLGNEGVDEYHIPREFRRTKLKDSIEVIRDRIEDIPAEIADIDRKLDEIRRDHGPVFRFLQALCVDRINQLRVLSRLARTDYTFIVSGWTPASALGGLEKRLNERFGERVHVGTVKMNELDYLHIPTLISNRGMFKSFELLMKLLPPPKYGNMDATPFISVFFPLFFGIILGDMAYGFALLFAAGLIKWKVSNTHIRDAASVAIAAGLSTVFFGFLYGEFLGDFGEHQLGLHPVVPWLHRAQAIEVILILAILLGVIHIVLGFALKTYVEIVIRHVRGIIEGIAKIGIILGLVLIFSQLFAELSVAVRYTGYGFIGAGVIGVLFTEGVFGLMEIFSLFGNILSYSRIMAIGLASVILAIVANRLAEASGNIIIGIAVAAVIHLINFAMGIFSPTIHSLRLHYVEFFTKFFKPEGKPFNPFRRMEGP